MNERTLKKTRLLRHHIRSHNKFLTKDYLKEVTPMILLANAHPLYRKDFAKELKKAGVITEKQLDILIEEERAA